MTLRALVDLLMAKPLLTRKDLAQRFCRTLITIDNWRRNGKLPKPIYLPGCRFPYWRPIDIERYELRRQRNAKN